MKLMQGKNGENLLIIDNLTIKVSDEMINQFIDSKKVVVGYKFSVNGVEHNEEWWNENDVFKTQHDVYKWLNIYGYGSGITKKDIINVYEVKDFDKSKYTFHEVSYNDTIDELCPHCGSEVVLKRIFANQICPECGALIAPCSLCDFNKCDCENCPLNKIKFTI